MGRKPRLAALWGLLATVAVLAARSRRHRRARRARPGADPRGAGRDADRGCGGDPAVAPAPSASPRPRPRMPRGNDVRAALRRALLREHRPRALARLAARAPARHAPPGGCPAPGAPSWPPCSADVDALAATGRLTPTRMRLAFLTLRRNTSVWRFQPYPHAGERLTFGRDPAVFQYFPGHGVQFHALATAGRANAIATPCLAASNAVRARRRAGRDRGGPPRRACRPPARQARPGHRRPPRLPPAACCSGA